MTIVEFCKNQLLKTEFQKINFSMSRETRLEYWIFSHLLYCCFNRNMSTLMMSSPMNNLQLYYSLLVETYYNMSWQWSFCYRQRYFSLVLQIRYFSLVLYILLHCVNKTDTHWYLQKFSFSTDARYWCNYLCTDTCTRLIVFSNGIQYDYLILRMERGPSTVHKTLLRLKRCVI